MPHSAKQQRTRARACVPIYSRRSPAWRRGRRSRGQRGRANGPLGWWRSKDRNWSLDSVHTPGQRYENDCLNVSYEHVLTLKAKYTESHGGILPQTYASDMFKDTHANFEELQRCVRLNFTPSDHCPGDIRVRKSASVIGKAHTGAEKPWRKLTGPTFHRRNVHTGTGRQPEKFRSPTLTATPWSQPRPQPSSPPEPPSSPGYLPKVQCWSTASQYPTTDRLWLIA